jgi:hypothetical protein
VAGSSGTGSSVTFNSFVRLNAYSPPVAISYAHDHVGADEMLWVKIEDGRRIRVHAQAGVDADQRFGEDVDLQPANVPRTSSDEPREIRDFDPVVINEDDRADTQMRHLRGYVRAGANDGDRRPLEPALAEATPCEDLPTHRF